MTTEERAQIYGEAHSFWIGPTGYVYAPILPSFREHNSRELKPICKGWDEYYRLHKLAIDSWWKEKEKEIE
jgi:hypothetical protein